MPAAEPYGFPQGCTVRPRKGAGKCSMGVDSISHYCLALPRALHPGYAQGPPPMGKYYRYVCRECK